MEETPMIISDSMTSIVGVLRSSSVCRKLVILVPAPFGTRIGPQRIYVEIARELLTINVASLTVDIPPDGDSLDREIHHHTGNQGEILIQYYRNYLAIIANYLKVHYHFDEFILCSISAGCLAMWDFARRMGYKRIILLSPLQPSENLSRSPLHILNIFGECDKASIESRAFWNRCYEAGDFSAYSERIIKGADHSFFGWYFKKDVCNAITDWLGNVEKSSLLSEDQNV
jgi:hypothetical protein